MDKPKPVAFKHEWFEKYRKLYDRGLMEARSFIIAAKHYGPRWGKVAEWYVRNYPVTANVI